MLKLTTVLVWFSKPEIFHQWPVVAMGSDVTTTRWLFNWWSLCVVEDTQAERESMVDPGTAEQGVVLKIRLHPFLNKLFSGW